MSENDSKENPLAATNSDFTGVLEQAKAAEPARPEISGAAIARMMGVATSTELKMLEGKLDLIAGRVNHLGIRVDKIISQFHTLPSGSDMERIDVQIGSLKSIMRDLTVLVSGAPAAGSKKTAKEAAAAKPVETAIVAPEEEAAAPAEE